MAKILGVHTPTLPLRNILINGDMFFDQRNSGVAISAANTDNKYLVDRWGFYSTQSSKFNSGQNQGAFTPPPGFSKYLQLNNIAAFSPGAGDYFVIQQPIEGSNITALGFGTSAAQTVTLSFWVRSTLTGTYGGALKQASARSYPFTYTINNPNVFEYKTIVVPGDTAGTWATDSGPGMYVCFSLGAGSTYQGIAGSWQASNFLTATGSTNLVATSGANWNVTGVMLNIGSVPSPYSFFAASLVDELAACQRYYHRPGYDTSVDGTVQMYFGTGEAYTSTVADIIVHLPVKMRALPTLGLSAIGNLAAIANSSGALTLTSLAMQYNSTISPALRLNVASGLNTGDSTFLVRNGTVNGWIDFTAELP